MQKTNLRRLTMAAMMGAIAFVLIFITFGVPFLSPVAEFDLSALPELIGGFILGPLGAVMIVVVKLGLKLAIQGTESMFTGELQNLILSLAYVLPAVLYYRKHRTKRGALMGILLGAVLAVIASVIVNIYLIYPFYMTAYGMNWDAIIGMCSALIPAIHDIPTIVIFSIVPFNVLSRALSSVICMLLYKKISVPLKKFAA